MTTQRPAVPPCCRFVLRLSKNLFYLCDCVLHIQPMMVIFPQSNATQTTSKEKNDDKENCQTDRKP